MRRCLISLLLAGLPCVVLADAADDFARGTAALREGDVPTAMTLLRQAADAGHSRAQAALGDLLDKAEQDVEAVAMYRKSAEQGDPAGELGLGRMLANGEGVPAKDVVQAVELIRRAAEKDYPPAIEALSRAYRAGDLGLPRDVGEAARLEARLKAARDAAGKQGPST